MLSGARRAPPRRLPHVRGVQATLPRYQLQPVAFLLGLVGGLFGGLADFAALLLGLFADGVGGAVDGVLDAALDLRDGVVDLALDLLAGVLCVRLEFLAFELGFGDREAGGEADRCGAGCDGERVVEAASAACWALALTSSVDGVASPMSPLLPTPGTLVLSSSTFSITTSFLSSMTSLPRFLTSAL